MSTDSRVPTLFPGEQATVVSPEWANDVYREIAKVVGSMKLYREAEARRAFSDALGPVTDPMFDFLGHAAAPKRKLNRRRTSKRSFREPNGARLVRRILERMRRGQMLTAPMIAALAVLCSKDEG
ncbi:hypothetical protein A3203_17965 [Burkholderia cenocepacia]|uniref:hypothetical protein n=1 Tax=Burkholderia cenocepacia TaxID=95486 RepID=UPI00078B43D7|nr:hypothetical protein [Burkholderia cenocepacia]AMU14857.1 hypothetical protein A3203_17965 [Burkholderia cenocepacia]